MKVDGQQSVMFNLFGFEKTEEASIKRKSEFDWQNPFSSNSHLEIDAGGGDDRIYVKKTGPDEYLVDINGEQMTLTREEMKNLHLKAGSGDDRIIIDSSVDIELNIDAGDGDDTIVNDAHGQKIDAGDGDDTVVNMGDDCEITAGRGSDDVWLLGDRNTVTRDSGESSLFDWLFAWRDEDRVIDREGNLVDG
jgi:Ca2+-binding RTX toxin-like protein